MIEEYWDKNEISKNVEFIMRNELSNKVDGSELNELIQRCGADMSLMEKYIAKYTLDIDFDEKFEIFELEQIIDNKYEFDNVYTILKHISIFEHLGYRESKKFQLEKVCQKLIKLPFELVFEIIEFLIEKKLINHKGYYLWLEKYQSYFFETWIEQFVEEDINDFINLLEETKTSNVFSRNLIHLSEKIKHDKFITLLIGEKNLFSNYNFINSEVGSTLVLNLVETNFSSDIMDVLELAFGDISSDDLRESFIYGRRNCIWALEKLAYKQNTAYRAIKLMYRFALSENEGISNNSTNTFTGYFQPRFSATILSLEDRIKLLQELLQYDGINEILIQCYDQMLKVDNFRRNSITFNSAGVTLTSYDELYAIEHKELSNYYNYALRKLYTLNIFNSGKNINQLAEKAFMRRFEEQFIKFSSDKPLYFLNKIVSKYGLSIAWREKIDGLIHKYSENIRTSRIDKLKEFIKKHEISDIRSKLEYIVAKAPFKNKRTDSGWIDISKLEAIKFSNELLESGDKTWLNEIDILMINDQRQTFSFAENLGLKYPDTEELIKKVISKASELKGKELNIALFAGIISSQKNANVKRLIIRKLSEVDHLDWITVKLTKLLEEDLEFKDLELVIPMVKKEPQLLNSLEYINLSNLKDAEIHNFIDQVKDLHPDNYFLSLQLLGNLIRNEKGRWNSNKTYIRQFLQKDDIFKLQSSIYFNYIHLEDMLKTLSMDDITKEEIAFFTLNIVRAFSDYSVQNTSFLNDILFHLLQHHFSISWEIVGNSLLDGELYTYSLKQSLRYFKFDTNEIMDWVETKKPEGPEIMMEIVPFENEIEGVMNWSDITKELLKKYNDNEAMLSALSRQLHSYMITGSAVPLYKRRLKMLSKLETFGSQNLEAFIRREQEIIKNRILREQDFDDNYELGEI